MSSILQRELDQLKADAWAQDRVEFKATDENGVILFSNFARAGKSHHVPGASVPGSGAKWLQRLCKTADRYGASIRLFCFVPKLINGLYADHGFVEDRHPRDGYTRFFTRRPHLLQPPRNPAHEQHVPA